MINIMKTVCVICNNVRKNSTQQISFQSLMSRIRREFQKHQIDLYIRSSRNLSLTSTEFYVNAYYDAEDELDNEVPIEIVVYHNFDKNLLWQDKQITEFLIQIYDAVVHEFRHQYQSYQRNHEIFWPHSSIVLQYLSDPDEIDAYAYSIAIELCRSVGKYRSQKYLTRYKKLSKFKIQGSYVSPNLFAFVSVFDQIDDLLLKKLIKKVYLAVDQIDTDTIFM